MRAAGALLVCFFVLTRVSALYASATTRPSWVNDGVRTLRSYFEGNPQPREVTWGVKPHERWVTVVFAKLEICTTNRCEHGGPRTVGRVVRRPVTGRSATMTWYSGGTRIMSLSIQKH